MMLRNEKRNFSWDNAKKMMAKVDNFKSQLERFEGHNMSEELVARLDPIIADPVFNPEKMMSKSFAAANLCNWVVNIVKYEPSVQPAASYGVSPCRVCGSLFCGAQVLQDLPACGTVDEAIGSRTSGQGCRR